MNDIFSVQLNELREWLVYSEVGDKLIYLLAFFLAMALLGVFITKKYRIPIVVAYVFLGILLSVDLFTRFPFLSEDFKEWYGFSIQSLGFVSNIALGFIAFSIGSELAIKTLKRLGKTVVYITLLQALGAFLIVVLGVLLLGYPFYMALLLGAIATATAPAATVMVFQEFRAEGLLTSMILAVVAIDDALALAIFSLIKPIARIQVSGGGAIHLGEVLFWPLMEIVASLALGLFIGYISQRIITNIEDKTKKVLLFVTTIMGTVAFSLLFNLSALIANMAVGFIYRNFTRKNPGIGDYMDTITIPLYAMFFIIAGTEINFSSIASSGFLILAAVYFLARILGKISGSYLGALISKAPDKVRKYVGLGLIPQSGVAIALAFTVQREFVAVQDMGLLIFNILLLTAALTEVIGPLATKYAIIKSGESQELSKAN